MVKICTCSSQWQFLIVGATVISAFMYIGGNYLFGILAFIISSNSFFRIMLHERYPSPDKFPRSQVTNLSHQLYIN